MNERLKVELTLEDIQEAMRLEGKDPNNWIQFCAWLTRNGIELEID